MFMGREFLQQQIFELTSSNATVVAEMMARLVPQWWTFDSALKQITASDKVGWYMGENVATPKGYICVKMIEDYSCAEVENFGYDDTGIYTAGSNLAMLHDKAEQYAIENGLRMIRTIFGSNDFSCHGKPVADYVKELSTLQSTNQSYEYMLSRGYKLAGFLPNCYGMNEHGIMIIKNLCE